VRQVIPTFRAAIDRARRCKAENKPFHIDAAWQQALRKASMGFEVTDGFFVTGDYRRDVLEEPSLENMARYGLDTLRNLKEGQTSVAFLQRSLVSHVKRGLTRPTIKDGTDGRFVEGF